MPRQQHRRSSSICVDLNTKIIPDKARIWALHSGVGGELYKEFVGNKAVFLDLPNLGLDTHKLDELKIPELRIKILRSQAWREVWMARARAIRRDEPAPRYPSMDLALYKDDSKSRALSNAQVNVLLIFFTAKRGDLVLVPGGRGQYGFMRIGEITSDFDPDQNISIRDSKDYTVQYRTVKWLGRDVKRRALTEPLAKSLENRRAAVSIDRSAFEREVYSLAYSSFITTSTAKAKLSGPRYNSKDARDIISAIDIISWLVAAFEALEKNDVASINSLSTNDLILKYYNAADIEDFSIAFSSPGGFNFLPKKWQMVLFVAGGIPLLMTLASDNSGYIHIQASNSAMAGHLPISRGNFGS